MITTCRSSASSSLKRGRKELGTGQSEEAMAFARSTWVAAATMKYRASRGSVTGFSLPPPTAAPW
jgi:hypothetical protein